MSKPRTIVDCYPPQSDPYADTTVDELARLVQDAPRILAGEDIYGGWSVPESLGTELPNVPAFDAGLLPEVLRPLVEDVSERMQTPLDFAAVVSVLSLAGVTGRRVRIQPKEADTTWTVVPNLWGGIVAEPGCLKSPLMQP